MNWAQAASLRQRGKDKIAEKVSKDKNNKVLLEVIPIYNDKNLEPIGVKMYVIDQNGNVIVDVTIDIKNVAVDIKL